MPAFPTGLLLGPFLTARGGSLAEDKCFAAEGKKFCCDDFTNASLALRESGGGGTTVFVGFEVRISFMREKASSILFTRNSLSCTLKGKRVGGISDGSSYMKCCAGRFVLHNS